MMIKKLKVIANRFLGLFPSALPSGMADFDAWASNISKTWTLPTDDLRSVKFMLASMIIHLGPQAARKPKYYFVLSIRAAASKQVAGAVFQEIKQQQLQEAKEATENAAAASEQQK